MAAVKWLAATLFLTLASATVPLPAAANATQERMGKARRANAKLALTLLSILWLALCPLDGHANHPDDSCPDTHVSGGESLDYEVTIRDTGQPVRDGDVLPKGTWIRWHLIATALGRCEYFGFDYSTHQCVAGPVWERTVNHIDAMVDIDTTTSLNGTYTSVVGAYGRDANGATAFYHVLDTHDLATSTGPVDELLSLPGRYSYTVKSRINTTPCQLAPNQVIKYFTVYVVDDNKHMGCPKKGTTVGNPCDVATGNKYQREVDRSHATLPIVRHYNSGLISADFGLGRGWLTQYHRRLQIIATTTGAKARHRREDGYSEPFSRTGSGPWLPESDSQSTLTEDTTGYTVTYGTRSRDRYDLNGRLLESTNEAGQTIALSYDSAGRLSTVSDASGHQLTVTYNAEGRMASIDSGGGSIYGYEYHALNENLTRVTYPGGGAREYLYENTSPQLRHHLTGIVDESGTRVGTYTYESITYPGKGRVLMSQHPGGAGDVSLVYTNSASTAVTDAFGISRAFGFSAIQGAYRATSVGGTACSWCQTSKGTTYDANANVTSRTDFNGNKTCYANDLTRNLETVRVEGFATGVSCPANLATYTPTSGTRQRKITTQWHANSPWPTQIDELGRRVTNTYDASGNLLTRTALDTATSAARTWSYTYNSANKVLSEDGPRTDVSDVTSYTYYTCTTGTECGQLHTVTNALGHITTYNTYNAHGQPLTMTDPNGLVTTLTYDLRQRLTSRTVGTEQTTFEYWATGLLKKATLSDGAFLEYTYDAAHRLTEVEDSSGNRIVYTLDAMGNRTAEQTYDPSNVLATTRTRVFDTLNRLWKEIGAAGTANVTTTFGHDNNGNQTSAAAPLGRNSSNSYDELNRLTQVTDALSGLTQYSYNALDQLTAVTDPRSKVTSYTSNALGDLTQQVSPDTGTTTFTYDSAGNLLTSTDARNKTATYAHDALNRVTSISYPDQTLSYTYDSGSNQKSRLTQVTDASGSTSWTYNGLGRVLSRQQSMGISKSVGYAYDTSGRLQTLTLPSGNTVVYGYTDGKVTSLSLNGSTTILSNVLYQPFGPTRGWTWGNSTLTVREYDTDGLITDIDSAGLKSYDYDDAFRLTDITDASTASLSQSYGYDLLDRLTSATGSSLNQSWTFDASGNRLTQGGSQSSTYTVSSISNRLSSVSGSISRSYSYDNAGNTIGDGTVAFVYNDAGRMVSATKAGTTTTYAFNALGQRVKKTTGGTSHYFVYDEGGHLVGEYDDAGALIQETIWLGDTPVATIRPNGGGVSVFYVHTDHLNTPRRISRPSDDVIVWRWDADPFGASAANEDPDGDSTLFPFQLRFAGQYLDIETSLHYNYFRDCFDPATGRYCQPDPMGVREHAWTESIAPALMKDHGKAFARAPLELNPYAYVVNNPVSRFDPTGADEGEGDKGDGDGGGLKCPLVGQFTMFVYWKFRPTPVKWVMCIYDCNTTCPATLGNIKMVPTMLYNPPYLCWPTYTRRLGD